MAPTSNPGQTPEAAQEFLQRVPKVREELARALAIEQELATKATQAPDHFGSADSQQPARSTKASHAIMA